MITYESLTKRIERARKQKDKAEANSHTEKYWLGYIRGCQDLRDSINSR